jgi:hypothetical protein
MVLRGNKMKDRSLATSILGLLSKMGMSCDLEQSHDDPLHRFGNIEPETVIVYAMTGRCRIVYPVSMKATLY